MIALAPENGLARVPLDVFDRLGARLRELRLGEAHEAALELGRGVPHELRGPLRRRALRARSDEASVALRLLCFDDAVPADDVASVFGAVVMGALLGSGVLVRHASQGVRSLLVLQPLDHLLLFGDPLTAGGDAVMAVGGTTIGLARAAEPARRVARALDVGCGAGALALYLARDAERVVAVDVNPRATTLGRINAQLNRVDNVEFRTGDLFAPVAGEQFDLVVSQPPFVPRPDDAPDATYLYGGRRGDELTNRLLRALPDHLAEGGLGMVLASFPRVDATPVCALAREALGPGRALLTLDARDASIDEIAASYGSAHHAALDDAYAAEVERLSAHLEGLSLRAVTQSLVLIFDGASTRSASLSSPHLRHLSGARVQARLAAERLASVDTRTFLKARLRLSAGLVLDRVWGEKGAPASFQASHPDDPLVSPTDFSGPAFELLREIDRADDVGTAIAWVSARHKVPRERILETLLPIAKGALDQGLLVPAS